MTQREFIFDQAQSDEARDTGIKQAEQNAGSEWAKIALDALVRTALEKQEFIVEEVWKNIPNDFTTHENRAIGAVITRGKKEGIIEPTGRYKKSSIRQHHSTPRQIWRSKIYQRPK
tara:strand:+ start:3616 stop:3963 length:348 start_codon:yes stop_codon:yes gene_type:complete